MEEARIAQEKVSDPRPEWPNGTRWNFFQLAFSVFPSLL